MKLKPGRIILLILLLLGAAYGIREFIIWRSPPQLTVSVAERAAAGQLFELRIESSKDVLMEVRAGDVDLSSSGYNWSVHLPAGFGTDELTLTVTDSAGNVLVEHRTVIGVAAPQLSLAVTGQVTAGDAIAAWLNVDAGENELTRQQITLGGEPLATVQFAGGLLAFAAVPFTAQDQPLELAALVTDEFGRQTESTHMYMVEEIDLPVELLQLSAEVLALQSEENSRLQAERLEAAMASPLPEPLWTEPFVMPASGFSSSGYGDPRRYEADGEVSHHLGADLATPTGTPVVATNVGVVVLAETLPVAGGAVVIDHGGGVSSRYYHLSVIDTQVGASVGRGEFIAEVGSTGLSTGPHLHWEMRLGAEPSNPVPWVDRLLPGVADLTDWSVPD